jgi:hypothetical protein
MQSLLAVTAVTARLLGKGGKRGKFTASFPGEKPNGEGRPWKLHQFCGRRMSKTFPTFPLSPRNPTAAHCCRPLAPGPAVVRASRERRIQYNLYGSFRERGICGGGKRALVV